VPPAAPAEAARAAAAADPSKTYDVVPVFYGTDRAVEPDPKRLRFGSGRGHKLQLGQALITVPLTHKVPHIERPWLIEIPYFKIKLYEQAEDPAKHFTVQEIKGLTEAQMLALVKKRLAQSSVFKDHAFVFVHGFNTSFDCALYRTAQIAYDLKFDGAPFVYSWPSGAQVASYTYDRGSVEQAEPMFAEFLKLVIEKSGAKSISLIAHSMGNELLLRVLERLKPKVPKGVVISQVILAAPDVDRDKFNIIAREITGFAKGVTLYAASNDRALGYSERFWGGVPRAGDVPASGPLIVPGVDTIDVTAVSTDALGLNHSGYAENPALLNDVKALVEFGLRPPDKRISNVVTVETAAGTFWRFEATN
jgi:esterase/lipase superfamily enzyme